MDLASLVRWTYASINHLGDLPALDFQYVMSGIVPAIVLALAVAALALFGRWRVRLRRLFGRSWTFWFLLVAAVLAIQYFAYRAHSIGVSTGIHVFSIFLFLYLLAMTEEYDWAVRLTRYFVPVLFCAFSLMVYLSLFPHLPRQLGGPQPRCASIDLVRSEISADTLTCLTTTDPRCFTFGGDFSKSIKTADLGTTETTGKVVRSKQLDVYFSNPDYLLVRDHALSAISSLYELRKETIRAIQWCQ